MLILNSPLMGLSNKSLKISKALTRNRYRNVKPSKAVLTMVLDLF